MISGHARVWRLLQCGGGGCVRLAILPRSAEPPMNAWLGVRYDRRDRLASLENSQRIAGEVLLGSFRHAAAGAQALFRAFLAEQDRNRLATWFWIEAYWRIVEIDTDSQSG